MGGYEQHAVSTGRSGGCPGIGVEIVLRFGGRGAIWCHAGTPESQGTLRGLPDEPHSSCLGLVEWRCPTRSPARERHSTYHELEMACCLHYTIWLRQHVDVQYMLGLVGFTQILLYLLH